MPDDTTEGSEANVSSLQSVLVIIHPFFISGIVIHRIVKPKDSLYVPSPTNNSLRRISPVPFPSARKLYVGDVNGIQYFVKSINRTRKCATPACEGMFLNTHGRDGRVRRCYKY